MCQCRIRDKLNNTSIFYFFCISLGGEIYLHFFKKRKKKKLSLVAATKLQSFLLQISANTDFACNRWQNPIVLELGLCFLGD